MSAPAFEIGIGFLGQDPETRYTQDGTAITNLNVASTRRWTKDGERQEATTWLRLTAFGKTAEILAQYAVKGTGIRARGRIDNNNYEKDGQMVYGFSFIIEDFEFLPGNKRADETASAEQPDEQPDYRTQSDRQQPQRPASNVNQTQRNAGRPQPQHAPQAQPARAPQPQRPQPVRRPQPATRLPQDDDDMPF